MLKFNECYRFTDLYCFPGLGVDRLDKDLTIGQMQGMYHRYSNTLFLC